MEWVKSARRGNNREGKGKVTDSFAEPVRV